VPADGTFAARHYTSPCGFGQPGLGSLNKDYRMEALRFFDLDQVQCHKVKFRQKAASQQPVLVPLYLFVQATACAFRFLRYHASRPPHAKTKPGNPVPALRIFRRRLSPFRKRLRPLGFERPAPNRVTSRKFFGVIADFGNARIVARKAAQFSGRRF
jgi:hypothetical protein